ncbi:hypothetical protein GWK47_005447 [Chionoecetes opilio]|uniref:Uncharacterized protein n=1 Tax=Chionoecetes opilio TaxID=41210 RepID=A0A8J5CWG4_CHIOP|nr:hypothetical protein GWK47_005447 [Chionoecetes opilio]
MTQAAQTTSTYINDDTIRRLKKIEMADEISPDVPVQCYSCPKKPTMPIDKAVHQVLPLKVLAQQNISVRRAQNLDFCFLKHVAETPLPTAFGGFNTQLAREQGHATKPGTRLYRVMINVTWVYPVLFKNFVPRLGGMHMLMSFSACVGTLMAKTGLEEIM